MNSDLEKRVPREILAELIEEGTEAFRGILEKLFNVAMQLERSEFLGAEAYERTASRRGYRNGFKGKRIQTRVGELHLEIPQVRGLRFYPKSLERGCRSEKALKLAIAEMYVIRRGKSKRRIQCMGKCDCGHLKGNPCGPLRPNTINVTMPNQGAVAVERQDTVVGQPKHGFTFLSAR